MIKLIIQIEKKLSFFLFKILYLMSPTGQQNYDFGASFFIYNFTIILFTAPIIKMLLRISNIRVEWQYYLIFTLIIFNSLVNYIYFSKNHKKIFKYYISAQRSANRFSILKLLIFIFLCSIVLLTLI